MNETQLLYLRENVVDFFYRKCNSFWIYKISRVLHISGKDSRKEIPSKHFRFNISPT